MPCGSFVAMCLCRNGAKNMKRSLCNIAPVATSHNAGMKRVMLAANESGCPITQIAITDLRAGEIAKTHIHEDMQEGFYVLSGELDIVLDGEIEHCKAEDFVWVKFGISHELKAITDVRVMTIGCEVN